ncbi:universal stress protein [Pseudodesulfovibrio sp. zrk46]|uniref:universal stress protein n=1 Tax=Pseudodesulfovibrio sp. zrk46 TaxID=2725288 RepID=UPI001449C8F6|nr:universal stress protein [Pseudodesulfovibrio sp. zrk46]QJB55901.1 universal stress protein [Pseudodesulfovibrio sp. zrk46]
MQKELLLAISDDRAASYNLRFLREVFGNFCDLKLTLFYVTPRKASWVMDKKHFVPRGDGMKEMMHHSTTKGEKALEAAKQWYHETIGCTEDNLRLKVVGCHKGTVPELIHEAREGLYDALLLGRRGYTWFEEIFENSVAHEMLLHNLDFPVWVCRRPPDNPRHDVLLCMDGSDASYRMVDHAAYMLAKEKKHTFTMFYVSKDGYNPTEANEVFAVGLEILKEHEISEERIEMKMVSARNTVKAIMKEAHEGNYSAVGVGKRGADADATTNGFFPSSVTVQLLRQLTTCALWISK